MPIRWRDERGTGPSPVKAVRYFCSWCESTVSSERGFCADDFTRTVGWMLFCPNCDCPTVKLGKRSVPGRPYGENVEELPEELAGLYLEARRCVIVSAFHASVMVARKMLMHIAVHQGACEGQSFKAYVDYLEKNNLVPPGTTEWVDEIRKLGNETNHEIREFTEEDAQLAVDFLAMLLRMLYEYPTKAKKRIEARLPPQLEAAGET